MSTGTIVTLIIIGISAGILSGFIGVGGGVIIVPVLVYAFGMSQHAAQGTSLFVLLLPVGIFAVMNYWRAGQIRWDYGLIIALTFFIGGYIGSKLALRLSPGIVKLAFGVIMAYVSFRMIWSGLNSFSNES